MPIQHWLNYARTLSPRRKVLVGAGICLLLGTTILSLGLCLVDTSKPHLWGPLNDQIGYTNVARSLLANGTVQSNTIFPSTLWQNATKDVLYMPGHPAAIAVSYKLFGIGPFQSILPSMVSYLIAMLAIYLIGARFYSSLAGLVASLLFALFPPILFFAYTAMLELTFVAAFTAAVCACLYLPHRLRPWLGPLCLGVPFLFRETTAFVAVPLGLYFWLERRDKLAWRSVVFVALSVVLLTALYRSDLSAGRPSLVKANIFGDWHAVYDDATAQQAASNPSWQDWMKVLPARTLRNVKFLFFNPDFAPFVTGGNYILLLVTALVGLAAIGRRDKLAWSFSALNVIAITALVTLFSVPGYRAIRYLIFAYALNVVVIAPLLVKAISRAGARRLMIVVTASAGAAALSLSTLGVVKNIYKFFADRQVINRGRLAVFEVVVYAMLAAIICLVVIRRRRIRRHADSVPEKSVTGSLMLWQSLPVLAIVAGTALILVSSVFDYSSKGYLLLAYALSVVCIAWLLAKVIYGGSGRRSLSVAVGVSALGLLLFSLGVVRNMYTFLTEPDAADIAYSKTLETLGHDNARMLVTPYELAVHYRYNHFPVPWAFLPYNQTTLELLTARFDVGTMVLKDDHPLLKNPAGLTGLGFYKEQALTIENVNFIVYKRPPR